MSWLALHDDRAYELHEAHVNPAFVKMLKTIGFDRHYVRATGAYARVRTIGAAAAVAAMALGLAGRAPLSTGERDKLQLPRVTNFANNADKEVALILRRADNDQARSHLRSTVEGIVTRPI